MPTKSIERTLPVCRGFADIERAFATSAGTQKAWQGETDNKLQNDFSKNRAPLFQSRQHQQRSTRAEVVPAARNTSPHTLSRPYSVSFRLLNPRTIFVGQRH